MQIASIGIDLGLRRGQDERTVKRRAGKTFLR
jgi:hypothetical protein